MKIALETAKEQQITQKQAWRARIEEEKIEKTTQVNKLIEKVKGMEVKQLEIKQDGTEVEKSSGTGAGKVLEKCSIDARRV